MTEQNTPSAPILAHQTGKYSIVPLAAVIVVLVFVSAWLFYHQHQQLYTTAQLLQAQLDTLTLEQSHEKRRQAISSAQQSQSMETADRQLVSLERQLNELQKKVSAISGTDTKIWLLAQADFLVKTARRKLWNDQDTITAAVLLKSADACLADMHDPSLLEVRRVIMQDINTLAVINQIDFDGIILKLNQLSNQVDDLRLVDNNTDDVPMDATSAELSSSLAQWRENLRKSWHHFMTNFISVRRRNSNAEPLLAPNQDIYLRENIRARLLVAVQAIPRHQNEIYRQSLETVSTWMRAYFDVLDPHTKHFLEELDFLSQQSIIMEMPDLASLVLLEKLMQTRVRNLLLQPTIDQQG